MYKIINKNTGDEFICDKVTIEGFDYYHTLENGINSDNGFFIFKSDNGFYETLVGTNIKVKTPGKYYKLIATTNPNISVFNIVNDNDKQYTKEDMIKFTIWCENTYFYSNIYKKWSTDFKIYVGVLYTTEELFDKWLEQRTETLFFQ